MILEELIQNLIILEKDADIRLGNGTKIAGFTSYRGNYAHLAIAPALRQDASDPIEKVSQLLDQAKDALDRMFPGYKGGYYLMEQSTPIWISKADEASGIALFDIVPICGDNGALLRYVLRSYDISHYTL